VENGGINSCGHLFVAEYDDALIAESVHCFWISQPDKKPVWCADHGRLDDLPGYAAFDQVAFHLVVKTLKQG